MIAYPEYEKAVFEWLLKKHESDPTFNFSIRQKASKGAENDYFIGTEKSRYFATTFWIVPVAYPGSSADLINLVFEWDERGYLYKFQFQQPRKVEGTQNQLALQLVLALKPRIIKVVELRWESPEEQKTEYFNTKSRKPAYSTINEMMEDVFADYELISPIVEEEIVKIKRANPEFIGEKIQPEQFEKFIQRFENRKSKYAGQNLEVKSEPSKTDVPEKFMAENLKKHPLNQILFGPPGTGKTYHTINHALAIIENKTIEELGKDKREDLLARFKNYRDKKQIEFTTFHQSMSYEDFVEGIKPDATDTFVKYEVKPGIFKAICEKAKAKDIVSNNFENAYASLLHEIKENKGLLVLETLVHAKEFTIYENSKGNLKFHANTEKAYEGVIRKEIIKEFLISGNALDWASYTKAVAKHLETKHKYSQTEKEDVKPHVLIIDEINRGNVSQIFGELITLLETDKRTGNDEALEVTLPYSKDTFSVPPNLFLIGTMNTADRSVEALDTALRRRFSFVEMPPKPGLLEGIAGISLKELLETINRRIEKLLDKDHLIGHSYLMHVSNIKDLQDTFCRNIIPLLQEYFFGDFGKIGLVLGAGFVEMKKEEAGFAVFKQYDDGEELEQRRIFRVKNASKMDAAEFETALNTLLKK